MHVPASGSQIAHGFWMPQAAALLKAHTDCTQLPRQGEQQFVTYTSARAHRSSRMHTTPLLCAELHATAWILVACCCLHLVPDTRWMVLLLMLLPITSGRRTTCRCTTGPAAGPPIGWGAGPCCRQGGSRRSMSQRLCVRQRDRLCNDTAGTVRQGIACLQHCATSCCRGLHMLHLQVARQGSAIVHSALSICI
jgi:hypothetical protein